MNDIYQCNNKSQTEYVDLICELLHEKYGEFFRVSQYRGLDFQLGVCKATISLKEQPDVMFEAQLHVDTNKLYDEFVCAKACKEIEDSMMEKLDGIPGYIYLKILPLKKNMSNAEDYSNPDMENSYAIYMGYSPQIKNDELMYEKLSSCLKNMQFMSGILHLYVLSEDKLKRMQNYFEENEKIYYEFLEMMEDEYVLKIPFEYGNMITDIDDFRKFCNNLI